MKLSAGSEMILVVVSFVIGFRDIYIGFETQDWTGMILGLVLLMWTSCLLGTILQKRWGLD